MKLQEVKEQKWEVSKELKVYSFNDTSIRREEIELHINIFFENDVEKTQICCSIQKYITKLASNPSFTLNGVMINNILPKRKCFCGTSARCNTDCRANQHKKGKTYSKYDRRG